MKIKNEIINKTMYHLNKAIEGFKSMGIDNPFDNYNYRTAIIANIILNNQVFEGFTLESGRTGRDAYAVGYDNIEIKTNKFSTLSITPNAMGMEFDKQNDPIRREETLKYNAFISSAFTDGESLPFITVVFKSENAISCINNTIREEQRKFVEKFEESLVSGRRIRDSIKLKPIEILKNLEEEDMDIFIKDKKISKECFLNSVIGKRVANVEV